MCNGHSSRVSQGGSIAVLRPTQHLPVTSSESEMLLLFSNTLSQSGTSIEVQGLDQRLEQGEEQNPDQDKHWIVIHRDGDLSDPTRQEASNPLYAFDLQQPAWPSTMHMTAPQKLHLGVGETGIVGRRVSVMRGSGRGPPLTLAEGVIGWN